MITRFKQGCYFARLSALGATEGFFITLRAILADVLTGFEASSRSVTMLCHSLKMLIALKVGSKIENAGQLTFEHDEKTEGFYYKVGQLAFSFMDENGKKCGIRHRPDALRLLSLPAELPPEGLDTTKYVRFAEFKSAEVLEKACSRGDRYVFDRETQKYRCLAAEAAAREIGCGYDILTDQDLNPTIVGNFEFLQKHYNANVPAVPPAIVSRVREVVAATPGMSCSELIASVEGLTMDRFCKLLVDQKLYVPLESCQLDLPGTVQVFADRLTSNALMTLVPRKKTERLVVRTRFPRFEPKEIITIRGKNHVVVISGAEDVQFRTEKGDSTVITRKELELLLKEKQISSLGVPTDKTDEAKKILLTTSPTRLQKALERLAIILPVIDGKARPKEARSRLRNFSSWLKRGKEALKNYGNVLIGLIDGRERQGHHGSHLSPADDALISEIIESVYASDRAPKKCSAYAKYRQTCKDRGQTPVSEKTFGRRIRRFSVEWLERKRNGAMAGAAVAAPVDSETLLAGGGRWFMHIGHLDEMVFDLATVFPESGMPLGTAWVVVMVDSYTRTVLAVIATFEAPSYVTTMAVLRECVARWGRLPEILFMDNGPGFKNHSLRLFAEYYNVQLCWRPPGMPRWGSEIERFIGDFNQRVANELPGAMKSLNRLRRMSQSHHPHRLAVLGLQALSAIAHEWCETVFDTLPHKGLHGKTPAEMRAISKFEHGERAILKISDDPLFAILSLPAPSEDGTAKVQAHDGVQVDNLYYWHEAFGDSEIVGTRVEVRYDPFDITKVYAFIKNQWAECICIKLRRLRHLNPENLCAVSLEIRKSRSYYNKSRDEILERVEDFLDAAKKKGEAPPDHIRTQESSRQFMSRPSLRALDDDDDAASPGKSTGPITPPTLSGFNSNLPQ